MKKLHETVLNVLICLFAKFTDFQILYALAAKRNLPVSAHVVTNAPDR